MCFSCENNFSLTLWFAIRLEFNLIICRDDILKIQTGNSVTDIKNVTQPFFTLYWLLKDLVELLSIKFKYYSKSIPTNMLFHFLAKINTTRRGIASKNT